MSEQTKPSIPVRVLGYGLFVLLFCLFAAAVELAGMGYLRSKGEETHRFMLSRGAVQEAEGLFDKRDSFSYLDPQLSHAHNPASLKKLGYNTIPGFVVFGDADVDAFTIVTLGGSTTDPALGDNWPQFLSSYLTDEGISARVLNGGVAGYSTNQELLKLIRDVLPLKPDLIISLNGVNDLGFLHSTREHPMVHPYQKRVLATVTNSAIPTFPMMPNAFSAFTLFLYGKGEVGLNLGTKSELKDYEQWYKNVRLMHAVSEEFQIPYLCFLQPVLGEGAYGISPEEQVMLDKTIDQHAGRRDYLSDMHVFYRGARALSEDVPYVVDVTGAFDSHQAMYSDSRHQNSAGLQVLAKAIFEHCKTLKILKSSGISVAPNPIGE